MPSLKDLKIRIASVKSTRKITKAMQMVAAAKLRRAQEAAEAARPYAERMEAVLGNLAAGVGKSPSAPKLLGGTGRDETHLLVVATAERGLCGGFNSSIVRLARAHATKLLADGKTVKILTVGKKGREQLRRDMGKLLVGHVDLSARQAARLHRGPGHRPRRDAPLRRRRVRRLHHLLQPLPVGDQPDPDRAPAHPRRLRGDRRAPPSPSTSTSPTRRRSSPSCCRAASPPTSSPRSSRTAPPSRARA